eukprot:COSAG01_NODE_13450_length_1584_cov_0.990572_2_plen_60_part_00
MERPQTATPDTAASDPCHACSYNLVNGTHSCGSDSILNKMLKADLNFTGFVTSDVSDRY